MTSATKPTVIVTGVSGNLGLRLLRQLSGFDVIGVDMYPPRSDSLARFEAMDLGLESSCQQMVRLLRDSGARSVVHLAFVLDPLRTGVLDLNRMWQINVAGTARVMEAITEVNRSGGQVETFIFIGSVSAYGPQTPGPVRETHPLAAHTLPYAIHKKEADDVVRHRAGNLARCTTYLLRPHIFTGASMQNYMVGALRGTPTGNAPRAEKMRERGERLPMLLPRGEEYLHNKLQFVHVDDVARLLTYILRQPGKGNELLIFNVAGRGYPLTIQDCARISGQKIVQLPGKWLCRAALRHYWNRGISGVPPEAFPYMIGSYTMDTTRLQKFLGDDYSRVIQYTVEDALLDSFRTEEESRLFARNLEAKTKEAARSRA
ncbi:MAG TPA: NAD-dependent epimerase/dehydratase family protein [Terriglobales bacterium]|nr:NAD-dependent epimerase/dehydratase family protein [Terriglobales bacterium]